MRVEVGGEGVGGWAGGHEAALIAMGMRQRPWENTPGAAQPQQGMPNRPHPYPHFQFEDCDEDSTAPPAVTVACYNPHV